MLADKFIEAFRDDEKMPLKGFANKVQWKYNLKPNRFKLARARLKAVKKIHGEEDEQYNCLWDYVRS